MQNKNSPTADKNDSGGEQSVFPFTAETIVDSRVAFEMNKGIIALYFVIIALSCVYLVYGTVIIFSIGGNVLMHGLVAGSALILVLTAMMLLILRREIKRADAKKALNRYTLYPDKMTVAVTRPYDDTVYDEMNYVDFEKARLTKRFVLMYVNSINAYAIAVNALSEQQLAALTTALSVAMAEKKRAARRK